jgi:hypothetical protein
MQHVELYSVCPAPHVLSQLLYQWVAADVHNLLLLVQVLPPHIISHLALGSHCIAEKHSQVSQPRIIRPCSFLSPASSCRCHSRLHWLTAC